MVKYECRSLAQKCRFRGVYSLEFSAAGRHDHYEGVAKDANVPKLTGRYQPIKDLTLRATYSNSFIAPNLYPDQMAQSAKASRRN